MKKLLHLGLILSLPLFLANSSSKTPSSSNFKSEIAKKVEKTSTFLLAKKRTPANEALGSYPLNSTVCTSSNGAYQLVMQGDRNLVLYKVSGWKALWSSHTTSYSYIAYCDFRYNGELYLADVGANVW
ncbi:MAG: hypothetical protein ACQUHE_11330 [Bacteroidia bacterium]